MITINQYKSYAPIERIEDIMILFGYIRIQDEEGKYCFENNFDDNFHYVTFDKSWSISKVFYFMIERITGFNLKEKILNDVKTHLNR